MTLVLRLVTTSGLTTPAGHEMNIERHDSETDDDSKWHLDKKVPISIIVALFVQFCGGLWFISKLEARVLALETINTAQRDRDERQDAQAAAAVGLVRGDIRDIGAKLDRLIERERNTGGKP